MANTFNGMTFVNIANRGLAVFSKRLIDFSIFTTDLSNEAIQGTQVTTRIVPASSAPETLNNTAGEGYFKASAVAGETTTAVDVTLGTGGMPQHVGFEITEAEATQIAAGVMQDTKDKIIEKKINALADKMLTDGFTVMNDGTKFTTSVTVGAASAMDWDKVVDVRTAVAKAHFPLAQTNMIWSPDWIGAVLKDNHVNAQYSSGLGVIVNGAGVVQRLCGMGCYEAPTYPTASNAAGFVCTPDAVVLANRRWNVTVGGPVIYAQDLVDKQTGAVITYRVAIDGATGKTVHSFVAYYGWAKGNPAAGYRLVSA